MVNRCVTTRSSALASPDAQLKAVRRLQAPLVIRHGS